MYEPIADRNLHYIKLTDMVTGRGYMDINRISGYLPGKIVFFLMQVRVGCLGDGKARSNETAGRPPKPPESRGDRGSGNWHGNARL